MKQSLKTYLKILIILLLYFLTQAFVLMVFATIGIIDAEGDIQGAIEVCLAEKAALITLVHNTLIILLLLIYRCSSAGAKEELPLHRLPLNELGYCTRAGVCSAFMVTLLLSLLPMPEELMSSYITSVAQSTSGTPLERLLSVVVLAPIAEELLFRGIIYSSFKNTSRPFVAVIASCALFGFMHQDPLWIIYAFLMGLGLVQALNAYGTLLAPILLHMAFNFTGSYIIPIMDEIPICIIVILTAALGYLFARCIRHIKKYTNAHQ